MKTLLLSFIPIFVAMDAVGVLPVFMGLTDHLKKHDRQRVIVQSIVTAFSVGIVFLFIGKWIFRVLGIMVADFKIAGGLVLLAIALRDLLQYEKPHKLPSETVGAVPIGIPLITGPAVLTTILIMLDAYGVVWTVSSFVINLAIAWIIFSYSDAISGFLGKAGSKAVSKIAHLFLVAIAIMMVRKGVIDTIVYFSSGRS